jgi:hypothetical protein
MGETKLTNCSTFSPTYILINCEHLQGLQSLRILAYSISYNGHNDTNIRRDNVKTVA